MKATVQANIEAGRALRGVDIGRAERLRGRVVERAAAFFDRFDVLLSCVSQVPPFALTEEWVSEIAGAAMGSYIEWMRSCSRITITGCPALSMPAGFSAEGLPIGVQLVGAPRGEHALLAVGAALEAVFDAGSRRPDLLGSLA